MTGLNRRERVLTPDGTIGTGRNTGTGRGQTVDPNRHIKIGILVHPVEGVDT